MVLYQNMIALRMQSGTSPDFSREDGLKNDVDEKTEIKIEVLDDVAAMGTTVGSVLRLLVQEPGKKKSEGAYRVLHETDANVVLGQIHDDSTTMEKAVEETPAVQRYMNVMREKWTKWTGKKETKRTTWKKMGIRDLQIYGSKNPELNTREPIVPAMDEYGSIVTLNRGRFVAALEKMSGKRYE